jgi:hypothetical protein
VIVIHPALAVAVHAQPAGAVTVTVVVPPSFGNAAVPGAMVYEQTGVGSVGDALFQLTEAAERRATMIANTTNREFMMHLPSAQQGLGHIACADHCDLTMATDATPESPPDFRQRALGLPKKC